MVRYMADSIDSGQIPSTIVVPGVGVQSISLRAGYVNGSYAGRSNVIPNDVHIDVNGSAPNLADVLDIEIGDATPDTAPGWVKAHNIARPDYPAVLYCNRSTLTAVANACNAAGLQVGKDYRWWIATLDGTKTVSDMTGVTAIQVWGANNFPGHNIDLSIVYDDAWKGGNVAQTLSPEDIAAIAQAVEVKVWTAGFKDKNGNNVPAGAGLQEIYQAVEALRALLRV